MRGERARRYLVGAAFLLGTWLMVGHVVAPRLIAVSWAADGASVIDHVMPGRGRQSVEVYLAAWQRLRLRLDMVVLAAAAFCFVGVLLRRSLGERARAWQAGGQATPIDGVCFAASLGATLGALQAGIVLVKQLIAPRPNFLYTLDVVWMAPGATALVFGFLSLVLVILSLLHSAFLSWRGLLLLGIGASAFGATQVAAPGVHWLAALVLAIGVAIQGSRALLRHQATLSRLVRTAAPLLLMATVSISVLRLGTRGAAFAHAGGVSSEQLSRRYPNVLLIILDTVRKQNLSLYGYERNTTPQLTDLGARGVIFENAIAPSSWTLPSHASMFTGLSPDELGVDWAASLRRGPTTLAEVLGYLGYATGAFVANIWYAGKPSGLNRGFQVYRDHRVNLRTVARNAWVTYAIADALSHDSADLLDRKSASEVNSEFLAWLDAQERSTPFFAFLNYFDAHYPYGAPDVLRQESAGWPGGAQQERFQVSFTRYDPDGQPVPKHLRRDRDAYDARIADMDRALGNLLHALEQRGVAEETVIIVTSDHGEQFGEARGDLVAHGNSLYYPTLAVPLIVVFPSRVPAGMRVEEVVETRMIAATVLDLVAGSRHDAHALPGPSLADYWRPSAAAVMLREPRSAVSPGPWAAATDPVKDGPIWSVISGNVQYIHNGDGREELYDLAIDPWNRHNVVDSPTWNRTLHRLRSVQYR